MPDTNQSITFGVDLLPNTDEGYNLGNSSQKWNIYGNVTGNCSGTSSNVTGTIAIENGGTGETTPSEAWTALGGGDSGKHADNYYALASHGNHVPETATADNLKFLRCDNSWYKIAKADVSTMINLLDTDDSDLTANDYVITQYVGGGTTTTTYHRRAASHVINETLVKAALSTVSTTAKKFLKDTGSWAQVAWGDLSGVPSTFAPSSHTHGNITNGGLLSSASMAVVTDSNKKITTANLSVSDSNASTDATTTFVQAVTQSAQGKITVTKASLDTSGEWSGNATSATLLKCSYANGTAASSTWSHGKTGYGDAKVADVWGQKWSVTGQTYTPSGGSATNLTNTGDIVIFVSKSNTSNNLYANMVLDGNIYATTFVGSGVVVDGYIDIRNSTIDLKNASNNVSTDTGYMLRSFDKNSYSFAVFEGMAKSNGSVFAYMGVQNRNTSGTGQGWKGLSVSADKEGNCSYAVTDQAAFRTAISAAASDHTHGWANLTDNADSLSSGSSDVTASTEILTSYATDNGFADTNAKGKVYRRAASKVVNATLVKTALGCDSSTTTKWLTQKGTWSTPTAAQVGAAPSSTVSCTTANVKAALSCDTSTTNQWLNKKGEWSTPTAAQVGAATSGHTHGNITNGGLLGTASVAVVTDSSKKITTADLTVNDSSASTNATTTFVQAVTQNAQGKITVTKASLDTSGSWSGNATSATALQSQGRVADANITHIQNGGVQLILASSTMSSTNKPSNDGYILHYHWDGNSTNAWDAQLYVPDTHAGSMQWRAHSNATTWGDGWKTVLDSSNYTTYAAASGHDHNSTYLKLDGSNTMTGTIISTAGTAMTAKPASSRVYLELIPQGDYQADIAFGRSDAKTWSLSSRTTSDAFFGLYNHKATAHWSIQIAESDDTATFAGKITIDKTTNSTTDYTDNALYVKGGGGFAKDVLINDGWIRTFGEKGWYNGTHGGGWTMTDDNTIKMHGNKKVVITSSTAASTTNLSSQLIVGSVAYNGSINTASGSAVGIELWRGANASWQIVNDSGTLHFKNNYTTAKQTTYTQDSVSIAYNTGNVTLAGGLTANGTLTLSRTQDASGTADNKPALIVGGTSTAQHIEIDGNEILSKSNGTTLGTLFLQESGGTVCMAGTSLFKGYAYIKNDDDGPRIFFGSNDTTGANAGMIYLAEVQTNSIYRCKQFLFRHYSYNATSGATSSNYEAYYLPEVTAGRTTDATYAIRTSKSGAYNITGSSGKISDLTTTDQATSSNTWRNVWISYTDNVTGRPAYDTNFAYRSDNGMLKFKEWYLIPYGGAYGTGGDAYIWLNGSSGVTQSGETASTVRCNKDFKAPKVYGAVWNDYAEFRTTIEEAKPGQVVIDNDDGTLSLTTKRLQPGAQVVTDTFGFGIGETENTKTPLAVSGRVLVYTHRPREEYHAGMSVCSAPDGTVDIMSRDEIMMYPDAIIGIVSEIPDYEEWGTDNVKVNGRIWIRVK